MVNVERALVAALMLPGAVVGPTLESIQPSHFTCPRTRAVFQAVVDLIERNVAVDTVCVFNELASHNGSLNFQLDELLEISSTVFLSGNLPEYTRLVKEGHTSRSFLQLMEDATQQVKTGHPLSAALASAEGKIHDLASESTAQTSSVVELGSVLERVRHKDKQPDDGRTIWSGLSDLDELCRGFRPGEVVVLAGRPSMGKSTLAVQIATHAALHQGLPILYYCQEETVDGFGRKVMYAEAQVNPNDPINEQAEARISQAIARVQKAGNIYAIGDSASPSRLRSHLKAYTSHHGVRGLFIDYLQIMPCDKESNSRQVDVGKLSMQISAMAREFEIPIILVSQLNRSLEARECKRPFMSDLRDSGTIEQDARKVLLMYRASYYRKVSDTKCEIIIAKNSRGRTGTAFVDFNLEMGRFSDREDWKQLDGTQGTLWKDNDAQPAQRQSRPDTGSEAQQPRQRTQRDLPYGRGTTPNCNPGGL